MNGFWTELAQKISRFFLWALDKHPGKLIGTILGFLLGLLVVSIGFWKALVLFIFVAIGFFLGKKQDDEKNLFEWITRFFQR